MSTLFLKTKTAAYYMTQSDNQLLYSQLLSNAAWTATNMTLTAGQTDPSAGTDAFTLTATSANATLLQSVTLTDTLQRTFSIYLKRKTGAGNISITVDGATYSVETTTGSWARFDTTLTASGTVTAGVKITTSGDEVYAAWAMLEDGDTASTYSETAANRYTVTQVTDADYPANTVRGCAYLDGRIFVMTQAGEIYQSAIEDPATWAALDFIQSQNDPDQGVFLAKYQEYIVALKERATEFFYDAANASGSVLSPVANMAFQVGCAHENSVKEMAGTLVWLGQTKDGFGRGIYRLSGSSPEKISTPQIDKILDTDDLATVYSWSAKVGAHVLYGITLGTSGFTLVFDFSTGIWSFFTYLAVSGGTTTITAITADGAVTSTAHGYSDGYIIKVAATNADFNGWHVVTNVSANGYNIQATGTAFSGSGTAQLYTETYFPVIASTACGGRQWMQDATSGALYEFDQDVYADEIGATAARVRTPKIDDKTARFKTIGSAELIGDKIASYAMLRWTDDDYVSYSKFRTIDLDLERSRTRRLGNFSRRAFEILHVKDANFRMEALEVEGG